MSGAECPDNRARFMEPRREAGQRWGGGASPVRTELYFLQLGTLIAHREAAIAPPDAEGVSYLYG